MALLARFVHGFVGLIVRSVWCKSVVAIVYRWCVRSQYEGMKTKGKEDGGSQKEGWLNFALMCEPFFKGAEFEMT